MIRVALFCTRIDPLFPGDSSFTLLTFVFLFALFPIELWHPGSELKMFRSSSSSSGYEYGFDEPSTLTVLAGYTRNPIFLGGMVLFTVFMFTTDASILFGSGNGGDYRGSMPNSLLTIDYPYTLFKNVVMEQPVEITDVPFLWHPHKSDERVVQKVLSTCYGIEVIDLDTLESIKKAQRVHLSKRNAKDFAISSPFLREAAEVFSMDHMGRAACFFRHPLDYDFHASLDQNGISSVPDNALVRLILGENTGKIGLPQLALAKQVVRNLCVVATIDKLDESIKRIASYFGWELQGTETCVGDIVSTETPQEKYVDHESSEWQSFYTTNSFDCQLYELAQSSWRAQIQTIVPLEVQVERYSGNEGDEDEE